MAGIKAALIGCGGAGSGHSRKARELGIEVAVFCDNVEAAARRLRDEMGSGLVTTEADPILRDESIDLLLIATHHDAHYPLALAGARAGKHLLVEKPMCVQYAQAVEVAEAVEKAGVKLVVNCKFWIAPTVQKARALLPRPRLSHGQLAMSDSSKSRSRWIWDPDDGGGLLISTAVHTVDLLTYLMDSAPERVYAEGRVFGEDKGPAGYPAGLVGTILWHSGALSTVISTDQGLNPFVSKWFHQVWDGERSAVFSAHTQRVDFGGCAVDYLDARELPAEESQKASMLVNLLEAVRTGGDTLCNARDGVRTVALCNALDEAARTGKPQTVRS